MKKVNEIIKELRLQNHYTQQYVADYLKIDRSNYSKYELGKLKFDIEMIKQLCILFEVSADFILGIKDI